MFGDKNSHKHLATLVPRVMLDILQQISSGYLSSRSSSISRLPLSIPMTTARRCGTADHQFLVQEAIPDDVIALKIGYLSI